MADSAIRTPDQRLRVFVSSTLQELADERAAVRAAIEGLRLTPVMFELGARPHPPQDLYRAYLSQSHIFVGVYWQSYGWVAPGMEISGLEDEYLLSASLPRLVYVKSPAPERESRLDALLQRMREAGDISYKHFSTPSELRESVADDLALLLTEGFRGTEVRGAEVGGPVPTWELDADASPGTAYPEGDRATGVAPIRVMIVDDQPMVRSGLAAFLSTYDDLEMAGEAPNGVQAVRLCQSIRPDVVLMDMVMPEMDGAEATRAVKAVCPYAQVLALTSFKEDELVKRALDAGATGYLLKNVSGDDLAEAIRGAAEGRKTLSPEAARIVIRAGRSAALVEGVTGHRVLDVADTPAGGTAVAHPTLPVPPTPLVDREDELVQLESLLQDRDVRLLTLTGIGGSGKTRMAVEVGRRLAQRFADGVSFVSLATVRDPQLLATTLCAALDIPDVPGWTREEALHAFLADRHMLLLLDNFEELVESAGVVVGLLQAAPRVTVLVTSRLPLRVRGEREHVVPPLPVPAEGVPVGLTNALRFPALELFTLRVQDSAPQFQLTQDNVRAVAEICRRLDGLPLALELAAARARLLPPSALLERLEKRLDALGEGMRDLPERQRSLRATLGWSYQLLDEAAARVFRRLAVFAGGWTLEAAEEVCAFDDEDLDVMECMTTLVEASLVERLVEGSDQVRFSMLETVREYAVERLALDGSAEEAELRRRHAGWYLSFAEQADRGLRGPERLRWHRLLNAEFGNIRAAADAVCRPGGELSLGIRMVWALFWYWETSGYLTEAQDIVDRLRRCGIDSVGGAVTVSGAEAEGGGISPSWSRLETVAAGLGWLSNDLVRAREDLDRAFALLQEEDDPPARAYAQTFLAMISLNEGDVLRAETHLGQAIALFREVEDTWGLAFASYWRSEALLAADRMAEAEALSADSLALFQKTGDPWGIAIALFSSGWVKYGQGDLDGARVDMGESARLLRSVSERWGVSWSVAGHAFTSMQCGDYTSAAEAFREALELGRDFGNGASVVVALAGLARLSLVDSEADRAEPRLSAPIRAARLLGAVAKMRTQVAVTPWPFLSIVLPEIEATVRVQIDEETWVREYAAGSALSAAEAVDLALGRS